MILEWIAGLEPAGRAALGRADWVSLKVDAADAPTWRKVNRPHASLGMSAVLEGMLQFATKFRGELATGPCWSKTSTTGDSAIDAVATFERLRPTRNQADQAVLDRLIADSLLRRVSYRDHTFYLRRFW